MIAETGNYAPPEAPVAVAVSGLTKRFGRVVAVADVSLTIPAGGVYGLLGPNGSGKTTLLSLLSGFLRPTAGEISLLGAPENGRRAGLSRTGSLISEPMFWPYLSFRDNLSCLQGIYAATAGGGRPRSKPAAAEIDQLLETVGLAQDARRKFAAGSTGMKQRLGIAAALLGEPELVILDEPTNGLDPAGIVEVRELIRRIAVGARTVILASHLLHEVEQVCDRVGVMAKGKLLYSGLVSEMTQRGPASIALRTTDDARAEKLLAEAGWEVRVGAAPDGGLEAMATAGREWEITRELAAAGIYVAAMRNLNSALEAGFMEVTAGDAAVSPAAGNGE